LRAVQGVAARRPRAVGRTPVRPAPADRGDVRMTGPGGRGRDYVLARGDDHVRAFWASHLAERERALRFVVGRGFDPRTSHGPRLVLAADGAGARDLLGIEFLEGGGIPVAGPQGPDRAELGGPIRAVHRPRQGRDAPAGVRLVRGPPRD